MMTNDEFHQIAQDLEIYHGIFAKLWQMGKPVFNSKIPRACVSFDKKGGFFQFEFNPDFYKTLTPYTLKFVICHEVLHVLLNHGIRSLQCDREFANIAMDVVINESLVSSFQFVRSSIQDQELYCWYDTVFDTNLPTFSKNKGFEHYYDLLTNNKMVKSDGGKSGDKNEKSGDKNGNQTVDSHNGFGSLNDDEDREDLGKSDQIEEKINEAIDSLSEEEIESLKKKIGNNEPTTTNNGLLAGTGMGHLVKLMSNKRVKKKKKWETIIKKWSSKYISVTDKNYEQWARVNRRFVTLSRDLIIPTDMEIDTREKEKNRIKVIFFLDTSGSCTGLASRFWEAAKSLPEEKFDIVLCCFDVSVYETTLASAKIYGGGGTSFNVLEAYVQNYKKTKNNGKYPDACFVITDGYGDYIKPEFPKNWYWFLSTTCKSYIPAECNIYQLSDFE